MATNIMDIKIKELLSLAVANKASDVHLLSSSIPKMRINGELVEAANFPNVGPDEMGQMIMTIMSNEQKQKFLETKDLDFSVTIDEARFRANIYITKGEVRCALRVVPQNIPSFSELNLPNQINNFVTLKQGFVLVTGPTGQGKSTSVASVLNEININRGVHIVTIEDPIEYIIKPVKSIVSQREVGYDTLTFGAALKSTLRQDPNVVFVGEMRDLETIQSALTIAETGHLVFSTLHTNSAAQTVDRIIDVFPEGAKEQIRVQLAEVITAVVSQRLIPTINGGRTPAFEIMIANGAIKNSIREGKSFMIENVIQTSADIGMLTMETSLATLVRQGTVSEEIAMQYCLRPGELQNKLRTNKI